MNLMPFGRFKGEPIDNQKSDYLKWLLKQVYIRDPLESEIKKVLARREKSNQDGNGHENGQAASSSCPSPKLCAEIIGVGLREITQRGGEPEKLAEWNRAADWLRACVRGAQ
jgi:hypothetical protein